MQTNIGLFLAKRARLEPDKIGLIFEGRKITYQEWNERASRAANGFTALGVQPGDRVGLLLMNSPEFPGMFLWPGPDWGDYCAFELAAGAAGDGLHCQ
ncbi:MAG: AMP-binding protein [Anaerolineae bacterium]